MDRLFRPLRQYPPQLASCSALSRSLSNKHFAFCSGPVIRWLQARAGAADAELKPRKPGIEDRVCGWSRTRESGRSLVSPWPLRPFEEHLSATQPSGKVIALEEWRCLGI